MRLVLAAVCASTLLLARPAPIDAAPAVTHSPLAAGVHRFNIAEGPHGSVINAVRIDPGADAVIKAVMLVTGDGRALPQTTSQLCQRWHCLAGVNGDFSGAGGQPLGGVVADGQLMVPMPPSPVAAHWQLSLNAADRFSVGKGLGPGALQSTGTSYPLLVNGAPQAIAEQTDFTLGTHPRTIIGWNPSGQRFMVTVDGRSNHSRGVTLAEAATLMLGLGATDAVNLDGGGSTTFVVNGQVANRPSDGAERPVPNAWVVVSKSAPPPVGSAPPP
ncbi:MAG: phosphodiester glycosidase family protein, partial [Actinomycetota bacterium]|nr:phosphodiester glycosidase family protein [Actinomycetota bacterium]